MQTASLMAYFFSEHFNNAFSGQTQNYVHYFLIASATEREKYLFSISYWHKPAQCGKNILKDSKCTSPKEKTGFYFAPDTVLVQQGYSTHIISKHYSTTTTTAITEVYK